MSRDRLSEDLWGEALPDSAAKMVQIYVSRLRKVLPGSAIETRGAGYSLNLGADSYDLDRFLELRADGRAALEAGDGAKASRLLGEAIALWRGPALAEFEETFAHVEALRLDELRLSTLEDRIEADLALGRHADVVAELETLVARHPLRERLRGQLIRALYASDRQAEALAAYRDARRVLDEELGIEPSPMLRDLERRVLQQDPTLAPSRPGARNATVVAPTLASRTRRVVGRERELADLRTFLADAASGLRRVAFVEGEPGSGKTALVAALLDDEATQPAPRVGYGRCNEQRGAGEPFMPVLDALGRMAREAGGDAVVAALDRSAPTWLVQMPWLLSTDALAALRARLLGATRDSMLREVVEALEALDQLADRVVAGPGVYVRVRPEHEQAGRLIA